MSVSVAIPTLDGGAQLDATLRAVRAQTISAELVVLDSSSTDGTPDVAARHGARVETIARSDFGHGDARNRLMDLTRGDRVAFLTQDAEPAGRHWLAALLSGLDAAPDVALSYGPYVARPGAGAALTREYDGFFAAMAGPGGATRVWRAADLPQPPVPGPATFASSANLCLTRRAWSRTPFATSRTRRTSCSRATCLPPITRRRSCPPPRSATATPTARPPACAGPSTSSARCTSSTAGRAPPRRGSCWAPSAPRCAATASTPVRSAWTPSARPGARWATTARAWRARRSAPARAASPRPVRRRLSAEGRA